MLIHKKEKSISTKRFHSLFSPLRIYTERKEKTFLFSFNLPLILSLQSLTRLLPCQQNIIVRFLLTDVENDTLEQNLKSHEKISERKAGNIVARVVPLGNYKKLLLLRDFWFVRIFLFEIMI